MAKDLYMKEGMNMKGRYLIVTDLDGTALTDNEEFPEELAETFLQYMNQGHIVAFATGRPFPKAQPFAKNNNLKIPIISANGGVIHSKEGQLLRSFSLQSEHVGNILDIFGNRRIHLYDDTGRYLVNPQALDYFEEEVKYLKNNGLYEELRSEYEKQKKILEERVAKGDILSADNLSKMDVIKVIAYSANPQDRDQLQEQLSGYQSGVDQQFAITRFLPTNVGITDISANKGEALKFLADYYDIPMERTIFYGNDRNDIPGWEVAEHSRAVANTPKVIKTELAKARPDAVILDQDNNNFPSAVADDLQRLIRNRTRLPQPDRFSLTKPIGREGERKR